MKTNVRAESLDTHRTNIYNGLYSETTLTILKYIDDHDGCFQSEISRDTGLGRNQVSGRCNELKHSNRIFEGERVEVSKGHYARRLHKILQTAKYNILPDGQLFFE